VLAPSPNIFPVAAILPTESVRIESMPLTDVAMQVDLLIVKVSKRFIQVINPLL